MASLSDRDMVRMVSSARARAAGGMASLRHKIDTNLKDLPTKKNGKARYKNLDENAL
jgi:hypothetical protein